MNMKAFLTFLSKESGGFGKGKTWKSHNLHDLKGNIANSDHGGRSQMCPYSGRPTNQKMQFVHVD